MINDQVWVSLFGLGSSSHSGITLQFTETNVDVDSPGADQLGNGRPADLLGDIGAIEIDN